MSDKTNDDRPLCLGAAMERARAAACTRNAEAMAKSLKESIEDKADPKLIEYQRQQIPILRQGARDALAEAERRTALQERALTGDIEAQADHLASETKAEDTLRAIYRWHAFLDGQLAQNPRMKMVAIAAFCDDPTMMRDINEPIRDVNED